MLSTYKDSSFCCSHVARYRILQPNICYVSDVSGLQNELSAYLGDSDIKEVKNVVVEIQERIAGYRKGAPIKMRLGRHPGRTPLFGVGFPAGTLAIVGQLIWE